MKLMPEGNRKFNLAMQVFWVANFFRAVSLIDQGAWLTVVGWIFTGYVLVNVGQKVFVKEGTCDEPSR